MNKKYAMLRPRALLGTVLLACSLIVGSTCPTALASGFFNDEAYFVLSYHPDLPLKNFVAGQLGVLQPTYARSYLVCAYLALTGQALSKAQQQQVLSLIYKRAENDEFLGIGQHPKAAEDWLKARRRIKGLPSAGDYIDSWRTLRAADGMGYGHYLNCPADSFRTATKTLNARIATYGVSSPLVKDWVKAQDAVFCHCSDPGYDWEKKKPLPEPAFPQAAAKNLPALLKADRQYQIAAANMYAQKWPQALEGFQRIAADKASPWSGIAPYLVARTLVRQATANSETNKTVLRKALVEIDKLLADKAKSTLHAPSRELKRFVQARLDADATRTLLANCLMGKDRSLPALEALTDYLFLLDRVEQKYTHEEYPSYIDYQALLKDDKLGDLERWIFAFQSGNNEKTLSFKLDRWKSAKSTPWLLAALYAVPAADPNAKELLAQADAVAKTSPAYLSAKAQQIRLLLDQKQRSKAKQLADQMLANSSLNRSARNSFLTLRQQCASDFQEFSKFAAQSPSTVATADEFEFPKNWKAIENGKAQPTHPACFSEETASFLSASVPVSLMPTLVSSMPQASRQNVLNAMWVRAALLNDAPVSAKLGKLMSSNSELSPYVSRFNTAKNKEERNFQAAYTILKFPGLSPYFRSGLPRTAALSKIDEYSDNWWPKDWIKRNDPRDDETDAAILARARRRKAIIEGDRGCLTAKQIAEGSAQLNAIVALGVAPNFLTKTVVAFARKHPQDTRVPEALHLAVKSTRYGETDEGTSALSKQAFQLLKSRYKTTAWAKKTKHWF